MGRARPPDREAPLPPAPPLEVLVPALKLAGLVLTGGALVLLAEIVAMWFAWRRAFA